MQSTPAPKLHRASNAKAKRALEFTPRRLEWLEQGLLLSPQFNVPEGEFKVATRVA